MSVKLNHSDEPNEYLYMQVKDKIKIDTEDVAPNTRIATRDKMIKIYGVTRTTIEKAISQLIGEGYLYSRDGSGTYIKEKNDDASSKKVIDSWGVILPNIVSDTYPEILRGIEDIAHDNNINVVICNTDNDAEKQDQYIHKLVDSGVIGLIIVPAIIDLPTYESFRILKEKNIPFVFCNRNVEGVKAPQVISNNFYGSYMATKHLIGHGYTDIAFVSRAMYSHVVQRYQGFMAAMSEAGLTINPDFIIFGGDTFDLESIGYTNGKLLLQANPSPDAFVSFNDRIAEGVYIAAEELGLKIGEDIGIVGYDDSRICEKLPIKLTTVRYPKYETGKEAAGILLKLINGEQIQPNHTVILQPKLVNRQSSSRILKIVDP